ncbi:MAG: hypothetical protein E6G25_10685 [Actinobacteria bacterium]|nr:MAG: hypothetical protein E6G25_10685 [Actinomycetota bacterium]
MKVALVACVCAASAALAAGSAPAFEHGARVSCPRGALAFGANPIGPASRAAVARERTSSRPQVVQAEIASDEERGGMVKHQCGSKDASRTVVVYITLRKFLPSASLSERVSFVSHFRSGWRVWEIAH